MKRFFLLSFTLLLFATLGYLFFNPRSEPLVLVDQSSIPEISTADFLFKEMTIPYLRDREYKGTFTGETKLSENSSYTTYLRTYDSDGLKINSMLTIPIGTPPADGWPAVVFVHGYIPPKEYNTTKNYSSFVDAMARNKIVVLKIDLRGHGNSEGDPGGGYYSADYVVDTLNAFKALRNLPSVDPKKISLWGHSMAGNIVLRSFVIEPEIGKIVIWAGAVYTYEDMQQFRITDASYRPLPSGSPSQKKRQLLTETYGSFDPENAFWKKVPATNYLDGVTGSVQIHHAVNDTVVNIGYSRNLADILRSAGISVQIFEYPTGGHNLTGSSFGQAIQRSAEFLKN